MAFGKRLASVSIETARPNRSASPGRDAEPPSRSNTATSPDRPTTSAVPLERSTALRDDLLRLHGQAAGLAGNIRSRAPLDPLLLDIATAPASYPLFVEDFQRHFAHRDGIRLLHSIYCLSPAADPGHQLPLLQLKLITLMGLVLGLNRRCLSAHKDGALAIALQSDETANDVDEIIVQSAVVAALLGNLVLDQSLTSIDGVRSRIDLDMHRETIITAIARARSHVLAPHTFERRVPRLNWPVLVSELLVEPHAGERMINDVYAPAALMALGDTPFVPEAPSLHDPIAR